MSQVVLVCPHCNMRLGAKSAPAAGTVLTCPTCSKQFTAPATAEGARPAPPRPPQAPRPPQIQQPAPQQQPFAPQQPVYQQPQPQFAPLQQPAYTPYPTYPQYQQPSYPQNYPGGNSEGGVSKGLIIGLAAAGAAAVVFIAVAVVAAIALTRGGDQPIAQVPAGAAPNQSQPAAVPAQLPGSGLPVPASGGLSSAPGTGASSTGVPGTSATPFSSSSAGGAAISQLPVVRANAALSYNWKPEMNYDYHFNLNADISPVKVSYFGVATYKLNPRSSQMSRLAGVEGGQEASGTAFVVHPDGLLVTCAHVVRGATKVNATLGSKSYPGEVVGIDDRHDLALIRVAATGLPCIPLGNSDAVLLAEEVRAVGFPLSNVLGTSVKVTRGTIAGIVTKNDDRLLQIDASINPGNSGGPLVNDRGEVVGINSAGLVGESVTNVGFAVPSNYALALLRSKGVNPATTASGRRLAGPELASAVTPAVAFVKVDLGSGESLQLLEFNGFGSQMASAPGRFIPSSSDMGRDDGGKLLMSPSGEVMTCATEVQMPLLMMPIAQVAIEKLPPGADREWESRRVTALAIADSSEDPGSSLGGMGRAGRYSRSPLGRASRTRTVIMIPAMEQVRYKIVSETEDVIMIEKTLDLSTMDNEGGVPGYRIVGDGKITWDKKNGAPKLIKQTMTLAVSAEGVSVTAPLDLEVELKGVKSDADRTREYEERAAEQKKAAELASPAKKPAETAPSSSGSSSSEVAPGNNNADKLESSIAAIKSKDHSFRQMYTPLSELSSMEPVASRREEVAALLDPLLTEKNDSVRNAAMRAVKKWGTQKNVPTLIKMLDLPSTSDRWAAMEALGSIGGSKEAAEKVATLMLDENDRLTAMRSLSAMGPAAEDATWKLVGAPENSLHSNACRALGAMGTQKSLTRFQSLIKKEKDIGRRVPMEIAARDIEKRLGK